MMRSPQPTVITAAVICAVCALVAVCEARTQVGPDRSLAAIDALVAQGKLSQAARRLASGYRFDSPEGLVALQQFSLSVLRRGLLERDPYERCYAASSLGKRGEPGNIAILEASFNAISVGVEKAAADGLAEIGDDVAIAALQRLYRSGTNGEREIVVEALAGVANPNALAALSEAAGSSDRWVRLVALKALGRLGNHQAIPRLSQLLYQTQEPLERITAARSLLLLGDHSAMETIKAILDDHRQISAMEVALLALGDAHDPRAMPTLKQALTAEDALDLRLAAAVALTHYNEAAGVKFIQDALRSGDRVTILQIGELLDDIDLPNAREILSAAIANPDIGLRIATLRTMTAVGGEPEVIALKAALVKTSDATDRALIARALGLVARVTCIEPLLALIPESAAVVRYTAAAALEKTAARLLEGGASNPTQSAKDSPR